VRGHGGTSSETQPVINPVLEKPLLRLHRATDVKSFWKAVRQLVSASVPNHSIGLSLQQSPGVSLTSQWSLGVPGDLFVAEPLRSYAMRPRRKKLVRLTDLFGDHKRFERSVFFRKYLAPQKCAYGIAMFFWKRQRVIGSIAILRAAKQGEFSSVELKLLRQLHAQFVTALRRIETLERERLVRVNFQQFLRRLPLATIILRWDLKPVYQNPAGREFCAIWEKGAEEAKRTKANSPVPTEILEECRRLKEQWAEAQSQMSSGRRIEFLQKQVQHSESANLRATIQLAQVKSAKVARPHFLIACEDLYRNGSAFRQPEIFRLPAFTRLTRREREVAQLACEGRSNKEIAENACLSLQTVKKHLHSVFRKLHVPSRTRLLALAT
jgi:DNA-binding CsgD family transcriptional regulator/PAS domain-containing protein